MIVAFYAGLIRDYYYRLVVATFEVLRYGKYCFEHESEKVIDRKRKG